MSGHSTVEVDTSSILHNDELAKSYQQTLAAGGEELGCFPPDSKAVSVDSITQTRYGDVATQSTRIERSSPHEFLQSSAGRFYDSVDVDDEVLENIVANCEKKKDFTQSRRLPTWMWLTIALIFRVNVDNSPKAYVGTFLFGLTIISAFVFTFFGMWYTAYDILSDNTGTTIHIGFVTLFIGFCWCCMGIYSYRLAGKLLSNKHFATSVRIHSRTLFKVPAAVLIIVAGLGFTGLNIYRSYESVYLEDHCSTIGVYRIICHLMFVSRSAFSIVGAVWNLFVGCILLSVTRTHTIGIRRFKRDLEDDAQLYELYWREKLRMSNVGEYNAETVSIMNNTDWLVWDEENSDDSATELKASPTPDKAKGDVFTQTEDFTSSLRTRTKNHRKKQLSSGDLPDEPPIMTSDEILLCYWKISNRMRITSKCLQRWLASWIAFVVLWLGDYVIYWLNHKPDLSEIIEFTVPVLILLIISSAYAEANGEGQNMIRCICPTKERYGLLRFLYDQPLQMQTFGMAISYYAILTVILAFAVAFASRLILDEVSKP